MCMNKALECIDMIKESLKQNTASTFMLKLINRYHMQTRNTTVSHNLRTHDQDKMADHMTIEV